MTRSLVANTSEQEDENSRANHLQEQARADWISGPAALAYSGEAAARGKIRLSLDVSPELNDLLESISRRIGGTKSEVLRKAIVLMKVALEAKDQGRKLCIVDKDQSVGTEIVGLWH